MRHKFLIASILLLAVSLAIFFAAYGLENTKNKKVYYDDIVMKNLHLNGAEASYSLIHGKVYRDNEELKYWSGQDERKRVLRLALFFQQLKENPLLFDPKLDYDSFTQALNRMRQPNEMFNNKVGVGYANPISFLQSFADASQAYQYFAQDISEESAQKMLLAIRNAQIQYSQEAERVDDFFNKAADNGEPQVTMVYLGGETSVSPKTVADDFQKIRKNAEALKMEVEKRTECFERFECERTMLSVERPSLKRDPEIKVPNVLFPQEINLYEAEMESGALLIHSSCWKHRSENLMYSAKYCQSGLEQCLDWPLLFDGEYYTKLGDDAGEKVLKEKGVERKTQSASAPYGCNDLTYKPKIKAVSYALENYRKMRLFNVGVPSYGGDMKRDELDALWDEGKIAENNFFDSAYPSDSALENLGEYYSYAYSFLAKNNIADADFRNEFLIRANLIKGEIIGFDLILNRSAFHFKRLMDRMKKPEFEIKRPAYIFVNRVDYSITFLNFSSFVWRMDDVPQYLIPDDQQQKNPIPMENRPVINSDEAVSIYGEDRLATWRNLNQEMRENLID